MVDFFLFLRGEFEISVSSSEPFVVVDWVLGIRDLQHTAIRCVRWGQLVQGRLGSSETVAAAAKGMR
jgi:hypothetical protein